MWLVWLVWPGEALVVVAYSFRGLGSKVEYAEMDGVACGG